MQTVALQIADELRRKKPFIRNGVQGLRELAHYSFKLV
jgi:hypothetical protein